MTRDIMIGVSQNEAGISIKTVRPRKLLSKEAFECTDDALAHFQRRINCNQAVGTTLAVAGGILLPLYNYFAHEIQIISGFHSPSPTTELVIGRNAGTALLLIIELLGLNTIEGRQKTLDATVNALKIFIETATPRRQDGKFIACSGGVDNPGKPKKGPRQEHLKPVFPIRKNR